MSDAWKRARSSSSTAFSQFGFKQATAVSLPGRQARRARGIDAAAWMVALFPRERAMQPFTPDDIYRHRILGGLSGSTAHQRMVFKVTRALRGEETYRSVAWGLDLARGDKP
jgi:hypothetical protein